MVEEAFKILGQVITKFGQIKIVDLQTLRLAKNLLNILEEKLKNQPKESGTCKIE